MPWQRWAAYGGNIDGNEHDSAAEPARAGLAILDHPSNLRHPTPFYLASTGQENRGFGFLAASPLFQQELRLGAGESLDLRYQVIPFDDPIPASELEQAWCRYSNHD